MSSEWYISDSDGITSTIRDKHDIVEGEVGSLRHGMVCSDCTPSDAALIVLAVNCHDELLDALKFAEDWISAMSTAERIETCPLANDQQCTGLEEVQEGLNHIRSTIAKAIDTHSPTS